MAQTLLLLTSGPEFDKIATLVVFDQAQSLAQPSQHTEKLPSEAPSQAEVFPNMDDIQRDLLLSNQHALMANQAALQTSIQSVIANQNNLESRMAKLETLMLQLLKAFQKGKGG